MSVKMTVITIFLACIILDFGANYIAGLTTGQIFFINMVVSILVPSVEIFTTASLLKKVLDRSERRHDNENG